MHVRLRVLRISEARAQPLDARRHRRPVVMDNGDMPGRIDVVAPRRHTIDRIVRKQIEPLLELPRIQQPRFPIKEILDFRSFNVHGLTPPPLTWEKACNSSSVAS